MSSHSNHLADLFRAEVIDLFVKMEQRIKHCVNQLDDDQVWNRLHESSNSIANLILHLCGNVRQWIIHGVGGEPDQRQRAIEFTQDGTRTKTELLVELETTVAQAREIVGRTEETALTTPRRIQGFDTTGLGAILDSLTHFQGHTQEIISLTRQQLGESYQFAWKPKTAEEGAK